MKKEYRIRKKKMQRGLDPHDIATVYGVEMWNLWHWVTIKIFYDTDLSFAKREAEELLEKLNEK